MNFHRVARLAALTVGLMLPALVRADVFTLNFTANGFGAGAPQNSVSGSFTYEAASATSPVTAVDSVNLTIAGHAYALAEIGGSSLGGFSFIGGTLNGAGGISGLTNDFSVIWATATDDPNSVDYSVASINNVFVSQTFQSFSITPVASAVPEPSSVVLLLTIALGITLSLRRLRTRPRVG